MTSPSGIVAINSPVGVRFWDKLMAVYISNFLSLTPNYLRKNFRYLKGLVLEPNKHKSKIEIKVLIQNYLEDCYPNKRIHTKFMMTLQQF